MLNGAVPSIFLFFMYAVIVAYVHIKRTPLSLKQHLMILSLSVYLIGLIDVTLFPIPVDSRLIGDIIKTNIGKEKNNFIPFHSIISTLQTFKFDGVNAMLIQILGNILLFFPFGFYLPLIYKKCNTFWKTFVFGAALSIFIEGMQALISFIVGFTYRSTDIDDFILNTMGTLVGYAVMRLLLPVLQEIVDIEHLRSRA